MGIHKARARGADVEDWRNIIEDADEYKVFGALDDGAWDFRTIDGLSRSTGLPDADVERIVDKYHPALIRSALIPDEKGRTLFRLRSRGPGPNERLAEARAFLVKSLD